MEYFLNLLLKVKEANSENIQFISASVKWTRDIDEFFNKLCVKWQYIFGSHLEAARYTKVGFNVVKVQNDKKEKVLGNYSVDKLIFRINILMSLILFVL